MTVDGCSTTAKHSSSRDLDEALAALIRSTKTRARPLSLVDIEQWLRVAVRELGSVREVADRIGISAKMLRQFGAVSKLTPQVQTMFAQRNIDSVDAAVHLSRLPSEKQVAVANELATGKVNTSDVRAICDLVFRDPERQLADIISEIKETRNVQHYVVEFVVRLGANDAESIRSRFAAALGNEGLVSLGFQGSIGKLVLNHTGKERLSGYCRAKGLTRRQAITEIALGKNT